MVKLTDDADYEAGETFENIQSPLSEAGNHENYYDRRLRTRLRSSTEPVERDYAAHVRSFLDWLTLGDPRLRGTSGLQPRPRISLINTPRRESNRDSAERELDMLTTRPHCHECPSVTGHK
ncbi:unnamed protein product [Protopolystoma xenopodis]|uniref:Uncharacterized protein n=1 Tax=Protopolystoma xenopodis TaxID=117903 RepID=A0A448XHE8_9PLAT|nr:unnamed protein product [Protopolystoma xenopodis]